MALKKLSFRDTKKGGDFWSPDANQDKKHDKQPRLEDFQRGLNKTKPQPTNTTPPPGVVVEEKPMSGGRIMKTLKDQAGQMFKQIFDGGKVIYDSRGMATASLARKDRKILLAMISSKASKEQWIEAQERVIERLMEEQGWDWDRAYDYTSDNAQLVDDELINKITSMEDNPLIER